MENLNVGISELVPKKNTKNSITFITVTILHFLKPSNTLQDGSSQNNAKGRVLQSQVCYLQTTHLGLLNSPYPPLHWHKIASLDKIPLVSKSLRLLGKNNVNSRA